MRRLAILALGAGLAAPLAATTFYLTIAGLGGESEYDQRFSSWAKDIDKIVRSSKQGVAVETLYGAAATKIKFREALEAFAAQAKPDDALVVMMIGHGSWDQQDYKINLPGPDLSATELAILLNRFPAKRQLVVNMTSSSGASLAALQREGRVLIMATKSGTEKTATIFARYFVDALRDPSADTDKNEAVSALEAFVYAEQKTAKFYETQNRIATEHAQIEDAGSGEAVRNPSPANGKGLLAARFTLIDASSSAGARAVTPERQALLKKKESLEEQIDQLKYQKAAIPPNSYRTQLNQLLLELAKVQAELDK